MGEGHGYLLSDSVWFFAREFLASLLHPFEGAENGILGHGSGVFKILALGRDSESRNVDDVAAFFCGFKKNRVAKFDRSESFLFGIGGVGHGFSVAGVRKSSNQVKENRGQAPSIVSKWLNLEEN